MDLPMAQIPEWRTKGKQSPVDNFRMVDWKRAGDATSRKVHRLALLWDPYLELSNERCAFRARII